MARLNSRYLWTSLLVCLLGYPILSRAQPSSYYVSPNGDDANPGTVSQPFRTIQKARDAVRAQNQSMTGDITVYLRKGTYELEETLLFEPRDSGTNGHQVIYRSYPGETASLCGGKRITGWEHDSGNRWKAKADVANFRQLYVGRKARGAGARRPFA